ncbi:MAG: hypothetical protein ACJ8AH_18495 [Stellaceae bacterium]
MLTKAKVAKPPIGAGDHPLSPDNVGVMADPLRDQPRMLDEIRGRVDDAGDQDLVVRDFRTAQVFPFMRVTRVGRLER